MLDQLSELHQLFASGRYSDVLSLCQEHSITPLSSPNAAKILAASYFCIGDYQKAYDLLTELESTFGHTEDFLSLFAASSRRIGKLDQAESLFNRALSISPDSPQVRNNYANLLIDLSRFDDALNILNSLLEQNPDYQDAISNKNRLIALRDSQNTSVESSSAFQFTLSDPLLMSFDQSEINYSDKRYFPKKKTQLISDLSSVSLPSTPAVSFEQLDFAEQALSNGNSKLVLEICSKFLSTVGQEARAYDILSDAYLRLKQISQAEICLLHALSIGGLTMKRCFNLASFALIRNNLSWQNIIFLKHHQLTHHPLI